MPTERIFVFTAADPSARKHLDDSIRTPVEASKVLHHFTGHDRDLVREIAETDGLYAWGAVPGKQNTPRWAAMRPGDWVFCVFEAQYHYVARVRATFDNAGFARDVWGTNDAGATWNLMYFLTKPQPVSIALSELSEYLNAAYMGFFRIGDEKVDRIESEFGSVEQFVAQRMQSTRTPTYSEITREDVLKAIVDFNAGAPHGFGPSTFYDLIFDGHAYPPKAIFGLAARRAFGRVLRPDEFTGGVESTCFRILRNLGFEVHPKEAPMYLLIRSNEESPYNDELGAFYHFTTDVPNYTKLVNGAQVVVDRRTPDGIRVIGAGELESTELLPNADASSNERIAKFKSWNPIDPPKAIPPEVLEQIRSLPKYNVQHAIRVITPEIYEALTMDQVADGDLVLLGSGDVSEDELSEVQRAISERGAWASWWSFVIRDDVRTLLKKPFYLYINEGRGTFSRRMRISDFVSVNGNEGIATPWPEITDEQWRNRTRAGEQQNQVFKTWLKVEQYEKLSPPLSLVDFEPVRPFSVDNNLLNQNAFGYARLKTAAAVVAEVFSAEDALHELFMAPEELAAIIAGLERKKNVILEGPPGVGKTFAAKLIAYVLMGAKDDRRVEMVQFHQSYAYEDFVQGWRPNAAGRFDLKDGIFMQFCLRARADTERPYVFIIDEINRGNLSKILGELMMLVEHDKHGAQYALPLTYSRTSDDRFWVPKNVYVVGLMNTADRSLAMVDYALRRRFAFFQLEPQLDSTPFRIWLLEKGASEELVNKIHLRIGRVNEAIRANPHLGWGFQIGHSHFCNLGRGIPDEVWYRSVISTDIAPLIKEYWSDQGDLPNQFIADLLV